MEGEREEQIRKLAYRIWQEEGYPQGYEVQHWLKAEAMWLEQNRPKNSPKRKVPKRTKTRKTATAQDEL
ncbi:MAG TPA: DUF2934 domain-containing protein [Candidatus Binatia bacterium]|nr:DUF2934 domain-containing protein [Candidatus Binatia bacterium]